MDLRIGCWIDVVRPDTNARLDRTLDDGLVLPGARLKHGAIVVGNSPIPQEVKEDVDSGHRCVVAVKRIFHLLHHVLPKNALCSPGQLLFDVTLGERNGCFGLLNDEHQLNVVNL